MKRRTEVCAEIIVSVIRRGPFKGVTTGFPVIRPEPRNLDSVMSALFGE